MTNRPPRAFAPKSLSGPDRPPEFGRCWRALAVCLLGLLASSTKGLAQTYTVSGYISDQESGERLIGANVFVPARTLGTVSNRFGFYSLTLPAADSVVIRISYLGFQTRRLRLSLLENATVNIELSPAAFDLGGVEVVADRGDNAVESTRMSTVNLAIETIQSLPAFLGEADVIKALQLLPGVQSGGEGSSGLYVRGGGPDQNLVLLDGAPVYNASHIFGFFSVFNADALQHVTLTKGGFPARYGGRLSSVIDISMKEGNLKEFHAEGAVGLIFSKLTLQGPIIPGKMSYIVSGRRTYLDVVSRPFLKKDPDAEDAVFFFYDVNAKINYILSERSRLYLSIYTGDDAFGNSLTQQTGRGNSESFKAGLDWGNVTSTLRWNYLFSPKLFSNTTLTYSRYRFDVLARVTETEAGIGGRTSTEQIEYLSGINDWNGKIDFDYLPTPSHYIRFGGNLISHTFNPGIGRYVEDGFSEVPTITTLTPTESTFSAREFFLYAEDDMQISTRLKMNLGTHLSGMSVKGRLYRSLQPRVSLRYLLGTNVSLKASFSTMQQYLHLLTNTGVNLPTDLWVAATDRVRPQSAWQAAAGITRLSRQGDWEVSVEGYYKAMSNLIEYRPGANFLVGNADWQDKIEVGDGRSYGGELFVQKKRGRTTGWLGYTISWTERNFPGLNQGETFPYRYDRRHDISLIAMHKLSDRWDMSGSWVYGTGNAITLATARFEVAGQPGAQQQNSTESFYYGPRNSFRMAPYHRLDLSVRYHREKSSGLFGLLPESERTWTLSVYNAYSRQNPFFYFATTDPSGQPGFRQVSLFPIIPSITWSFKF